MTNMTVENNNNKVLNVPALRLNVLFQILGWL